MSKSEDKRLHIQWKARAEKAEAELTAAQEHLAEMRELLERVDDYDASMEGGDVFEIAISLDTLKQIRKVLSDAPSGGRVVWKGKQSVYVDTEGVASICMMPLILGRNLEIEQGEQLTVTVKEAPDGSPDDSWVYPGRMARKAYEEG